MMYNTEKDNWNQVRRYQALFKYITDISTGYMVPFVNNKFTENQVYAMFVMIVFRFGFQRSYGLSLEEESNSLSHHL